MKYYFLTSLLPPLKLEEKPELSFEELQLLLPTNLTPEDLAKAQVISRLVDIYNVRAYWNHQALDHHGNLSPQRWDEILITHEGLPPYFTDYLDRYATTEERLKHYPLLFARFFQEEVSVDREGFLGRYLKFEKEWRLVMVGFRAHQLHRDILAELQYEDPHDDFVVQLIAQKEAKEFEPPSGYENLKPIFEKYAKFPLELHKALTEYRLQRIEAMAQEDFSIDVILSYLARVIIIEKWQDLNQEAGTKIMKTLIFEEA